MRRAVAGLIGLLFAVLCIGCATPAEVQVDPALFARRPAANERRVPGRVAVWMPPQVTRTVEAKTLLEAASVPIGRIVEEATLAAMGDTLRGCAVLLKEPPTPGSEFDAILVVEALRFTVEERTEAQGGLFVLLVGPVRVTYGHLAFDLSLLDAQGRKLWTRSYDAGREKWFPPAVWTTPPAPWTTLPGTYSVMTRSHEAAWRLAQQVATDVSDWLATAERNKPRQL